MHGAGGPGASQRTARVRGRVRTRPARAVPAQTAGPELRRRALARRFGRTQCPGARRWRVEQPAVRCAAEPRPPVDPRARHRGHRGRPRRSPAGVFAVRGRHPPGDAGVPVRSAQPVLHARTAGDPGQRVPAAGDGALRGPGAAAVRDARRSPGAHDGARAARRHRSAAGAAWHPAGCRRGAADGRRPVSGRVRRASLLRLPRGGHAPAALHFQR